METCIVQKITSIEEYVELCEIASKLNHHNSSNYSVDKIDYYNYLSKVSLNSVEF